MIIDKPCETLWTMTICPSCGARRTFFQHDLVRESVIFGCEYYIVNQNQSITVMHPCTNDATYIAAWRKRHDRLNQLQELANDLFDDDRNMRVEVEMALNELHAKGKVKL